MHTVYLARDPIEAELLLQRLRDRGIPCVAHGSLLQGLVGEIPPTAVRVCVLEERDVTAAWVCLKEMAEALGAPDGPDIPCPRCHEDNPANFEECWKCRAELRP